MLDLGAGTGKLTATLVALGAEVVAFEPDPAMLTERAAAADFPALSGSAEAIPLPDASVDAVLAGNAMHWFDMDVTGPESPGSSHRRHPGRSVERLRHRVDWVAGLERISGSAAIGRGTRSAVAR